MYNTLFTYKNSSAMLQPKDVLAAKNKRQRLQEKKEEKFGSKNNTDKVMVVKPIDLDSDNSDQDSKMFRAIIFTPNKQASESKQLKKELSSERSKNSLSPKKFNHFNYQRLTKLHQPIVAEDLKSSNEGSTLLEVVEDNGGIDLNEKDAYRPFKFFVEGFQDEKNIRKIVLKDRIQTCINGFQKQNQQKQDPEVEQIVGVKEFQPVMNSIFKKESSDEEKEEKRNRYFDISHERCYKCGKEGHYAKNCIEEWNRKCKNCFSHDHEERNCPQICYKCGTVGHVSRDCTESQDKKCEICSKRGHTFQFCGGIVDGDRDMSRIQEIFPESDLKKIKCIVPDHKPEQLKKCNKFNCFDYNKKNAFPYQELRQKSKKIERVNLKDYQFDDQRRSNRHEMRLYEDRGNSYKNSIIRERVYDHYKQRYNKEKSFEFEDDAIWNRRDMSQNRSFDSREYSNRKHQSQNSNRQRQYYY